MLQSAIPRATEHLAECLGLLMNDLPHSLNVLWRSHCFHTAWLFHFNVEAFVLKFSTHCSMATAVASLKLANEISSSGVAKITYFKNCQVPLLHPLLCGPSNAVSLTLMLNTSFSHSSFLLILPLCVLLGMVLCHFVELLVPSLCLRCQV